MRTARPGTPRTRLLPVLFLLGCAILTSCGGPTDQPGPSDVTETSSPAASPGSPSPTISPTISPTTSPTIADTSNLRLAFDDGTGKLTTWQLTCEPPGGNHFDPAAACAALAKNGASALPAVPKDKMCTQNIAGPQTAVLLGTYRSQRVQSRFNLRNGCEIARWKALEGLLPPINS